MFDLIDTAITGDQFLLALHDTLIMVAVSLGFGALIGVPLGIVLVVCRPGGIVANPVVHQALNPLINVLRSLPFIILLIVILPFTRLLVGTTIGTAGAIVPLIVFVAPYIARLVESSLLEVDEGILEAADAMGATPPADCLALYAAGGSGIADSGPHHGDHRSARRHSHGGYSGRRGNRGSGYYLWLSALRRFRHPHYRPGADCDCPAYPDAGHPTGSPTASRLIALPRRG